MNFELSEAHALLGRTPPMLDAWLRGLPRAWLSAAIPSSAK